MNSDLITEGLTPTGLNITRDITFAEAQSTMAVLSSLHDGTSWAIGDLLNYSEHKFGQEWAALIEESRYAYGTIRNWKWVAGAIPPENRRAGLSWAHHQEVAPYPPDEQDAWLQIAEDEKLSRDGLRMRIKGELLLGTGNILLPRKWTGQDIYDRFSTLLTFVPDTGENEKLIQECRDILDDIKRYGNTRSYLQTHSGNGRPSHDEGDPS